MKLWKFMTSEKSMIRHFRSDDVNSILQQNLISLGLIFQTLFNKIPVDSWVFSIASWKLEQIWTLPSFIPVKVAGFICYFLIKILVYYTWLWDIRNHVFLHLKVWHARFTTVAFKPLFEHLWWEYCRLSILKRE